MSKPKWIEFGKPKKSDSGKTQIWEVWDSDGWLPLGKIEWYGRWRKYSFFPEGSTVYEQDCLREIADFCEGESKKHRRKWKK